MKPSEKVIKTIRQLIDDDWLSADNQKYSKKQFEEMIDNDPQRKLEYTVSAICIVLDEMAEKTKLAGMGFGDF